MTKNIVICCDGTGNEFRAHGNTNVVKLYKALAKDDPAVQIAYYDPGVGTISDPRALTPLVKRCTILVGLAFGSGVKRNIRDAYLYLMNHYEPGDRIYLFGFSRGAYTVRALAGMIRMCGLLVKGSDNLVPFAIKTYMQRRRVKPKWARNRLTSCFSYLLYFCWKKKPDFLRAYRFKKTFANPCDIHFVGVWDTVKSIGWFTRRLVLPYTKNNPIIKSGRHAVSIDEKRSQ